MAFRQSLVCQPCDSYFVESFDDAALPSQMDPRERARMIARERQLGIAQELSRLTGEEYQDDVLQHMEHMEVWSSLLSARRPP